MDKPKRKHNLAWHDPPEAKRKRQANRRDRLAQIAIASGFKNWSEVETAVLNGKAKITKITE